MAFLTLLRNWKLISGVAMVAAGIGLVVYIKSLQSSVDELKQSNAAYQQSLSTAENVNRNLIDSLERAEKEAQKRIEIVEITAVRRDREKLISSEIVKDLPDETPYCGPWGEYFSRVVQQSTKTNNPN